MVKRLNFGFLFLFFCLVVGGCQCLSNFRETKEVYLGEYASLTGPVASFGINAHLGVQLAVKEANGRSQETGFRFKLLTIDDEGDPLKAAQAVKKLIDQRVVAIIGEASSDLSMAGAKVAQENKVPMITPSSTNPKVTQAGDFIFRACFVDAFQGTVMAKFAYQDLRATQVAVMRDVKSEYSVGLADFFIDKFKAMGGTITVDLKYKSGDLDFRDQLIKIKSSGSDAIYIPGYYTEVGLIARQARQLGITAKFLGGDGWESSQLYSIGEDAINGAFFSNHFAVESLDENAKAFVQKFRHEYELIPDGGSALAYDATNILINAVIRSENPTPQKVRDEIAKTTNFRGATGEINFRQSRDPVKSAVIVRVDGKTNRFVTTVAP